MKQRYPSTRTLANRFRLMLGGDESISGDVEIVDRSPDPCSSTFPSEIVTCRIGDQGPLKLLCKYSRSERRQLPAWHLSHGSRHGTGYEAWVYRHVLEPLQMTTPRLWGTYEGRSGWVWLALEYLDDSIRINSAPQWLESAAAWIGRFHACNETRLSEPAVQFLSTYTVDYYRGWVRRTLKYGSKFRNDCRHLGVLSGAFEPGIDALLEPPLTIIHGEYYPSNVLWRSDGVYPVDWETAAIAAGEIDLAALTEHWPAETAERCEAAYVRARWPAGGDDAAFARRLSAARLYMLLRWTGTARAWRNRESRIYYLRRLAGELESLNERHAVELAPVVS